MHSREFCNGILRIFARSRIYQSMYKLQRIQCENVISEITKRESCSSICYDCLFQRCEWRLSFKERRLGIELNHEATNPVPFFPTIAVKSAWTHCCCAFPYTSFGRNRKVPGVYGLPSVRRRCTSAGYSSSLRDHRSLIPLFPCVSHHPFRRLFFLLWSFRHFPPRFPDSRAT